MAITSANQLELLQTAEAVAREKMIDPDLVIQAMEESLARAAKSRYGAELDIRVKIDRKTGRATFARIRTVVEDDAVENYQAQLTVEQAKAVPRRSRRWATRSSTRFRRSTWAASPRRSAKQVILQKVREAERDRQFEEFKDRKGRSSTAWSSARNTATSSSTYRARRGDPAPQREDRPRKLPHRRPHPLLHQGRAPRGRAGRRSSCRAPTRSSWPNCSRWKCRKSTTASSRSRPWPATRAAGRRSPSSAMTTPSTRSVPASACAAAACRPW